MIWVLIFAIVILVSFVLAWKSMKDFQEIPSDNLTYGLFLIRRKESIDIDFLLRLHQRIASLKSHFSLERLFHGLEEAAVIYLPTVLVEEFPNLQLLELENYLPNKDLTTSWVTAAKSQSDFNVKEGFLKNLNLEPNQQFFSQIVADASSDGNFQVTMRNMVVEPDPVKKIDLAKRIEQNIFENSGLTRAEASKSPGLIYEDFLKRGLIPKQVHQFSLSPENVSQLLS
jgi:hypothetical protein